MLREAEELQSQGANMADAYRKLGISRQTYCSVSAGGSITRAWRESGGRKESFIGKLKDQLLN
jgi:hypothetical protein